MGNTDRSVMRIIIYDFVCVEKEKNSVELPPIGAHTYGLDSITFRGCTRWNALCDDSKIMQSAKNTRL